MWPFTGTLSDDNAIMMEIVNPVFSTRSTHFILDLAYWFEIQP